MDPSSVSPDPHSCACVIMEGEDILVPMIQGYGEVTVSHALGQGSAQACPNCGYIRFPSLKSEDHLAYLTTSWSEANRAWRNPETDFADWRRKERANTILSVVKPFGFDHRSTFHEMDCAFGGTVFELQSRGVIASGSDIDSNAIFEGRAFGVTETFAKTASEEPKGPGPFDVVFSFFSLERQINLYQHINQIARMLVEDGLIVVITANSMSLTQLVYGTARHEWTDYPRRLHYLSPKSMQCLAASTNLVIMDIASRNTGTMEKARRTALKARPDSPLALALGDWAIENSLLGDELRVVLGTRHLAQAYPRNVAAAQKRIDDHWEFEKRQREIGSASYLAEPWSEV
jgi:hypothetical protein